MRYIFMSCNTSLYLYMFLSQKYVVVPNVLCAIKHIS